MTHFGKYQNTSLLREALKWGEIEKPYVAIVDNALDYNSIDEPNYRKMPLTFEITGDGNIYWKTEDNYYTVTIDYKLNDGEWTSITSDADTPPTISVVAGDTVQFRGDTPLYNDYSNSFSGSTAQFKAKGNVMSLIDKTDFSTLTTLTHNREFFKLFYKCTGLTDASNLILPATTLAEECYRLMFQGCRSLTTAPELPATTLTEGCYYDMFSGCTSLSQAPELPATTLALSCYKYMFEECTNLMSAPVLPATTLAEECYRLMFQGCTSLTTAPELPATTLAQNCYSGMFENCSSLITAPELPATTLVKYCYSSMFSNCTKLNYIKCLATDISASNCTSNWVNGVSSSGTFEKAASTVWETGQGGIPEGWTVVDAS